MSDDVPAVMERGAPPSGRKPGEKGYVGGLPPEEHRRIRAKVRRYCADGGYPEFLRDAKRAMFEHALKVEAMARYSEDANATTMAAAAFRRAVADIAAAFAPAKK